MSRFLIRDVVRAVGDNGAAVMWGLHEAVGMSAVLLLRISRDRGQSPRSFA